jgi:hypothetical protein
MISAEEIDDYLLKGKAVVVRDLGIFDYLQTPQEHMAKNLIGVADNVEEAYLLCMDTLREERHNMPKAERKYLIFDGTETMEMPDGFVQLSEPYKFSEENTIRRKRRM